MAPNNRFTQLIQRSVMRKVLCVGGALLVLGVYVGLLVVLQVQIPSIRFVRSISGLPPHPDAILVLGAGIEDSGVPSEALVDRLTVGERISVVLHTPMLLTGDGGSFRQAEIPVMVQWLTDHSVAPDRLIVDDQGYRTYESCKRAAEVYHLKQVVIITQRFHLGRAIYLCRAFGIEAYGVPANVRWYKKDVWFVARDVAASIKAWLDINFLHPKPPV